MARLQQLEPLAPLHLPPALELMRQAMDVWPDSAHVACFDTAFHRTLPEVARRFALPSALHDQGVRRYGFHGLSYEYVLSTFGASPPRRLVIAHLGSGASMVAVREGCSIDTTMGLTPAGGLPMGSRSGDLDPGVLLYLLRELSFTTDQLEQLVNHDAGLKGLAGTAKMTELLQRSDVEALTAVELFAYAIRKQIGAYAAALGGLDCLVFTGGIGEHAPRVRELVCRDLGFLGIELDRDRNATSAEVISPDAALCSVRVICTNEDLMIARATRAVVEAVRA
jgi:acetate kinase